ncbi:MAG: AI-2E family transporter [Propionibacteriaceae bacterium]|nr:AI-2E family transporter [Propionibacteriaceae bacterium]
MTQPDAPAETVSPEVAMPVATPAPPSVAGPRSRVLADLGHPFVWGFTVAFGALAAWALGGAVVSLSAVLVYIGVALFMALALDPLVRWLEGRKMSRGLSITVVFVAFAVLMGGLMAIVLPMAIQQVIGFAQAVPGYITNLQNSDWLNQLVQLTGNEQIVDDLLNQVRTYLSNPSNIMSIAGGALAVGSGIMSGVTGAMFILILTLYFLATLRGMKAAMYRLAPAYARLTVAKLTDQITESVGGYVTGMFILAAANAVFSFILLTLLGYQFAALLAVLALFITMIPMIGPAMFWVIASIACFFDSWWVGLTFTIVYFAYMQVEAYLMTPKIMSKQISIPGSLVIIGALVGGTLLGLLGALVAVPVTAAILMLVEELFIPKQDAKLTAPEDSSLA